VSDANDFEKFWTLYPRKVAKADARKAWGQMAKVRPAIADIEKSLHAARASKQWQKDDGDFIPYPASWIRGERWADEYEVDLSQLHSSSGKVCAYCGKPATASPNNIHACREHFDWAMEGRKTNVVSMKVA
jgi:hypothetical protein